MPTRRFVAERTTHYPVRASGPREAHGLTGGGFDSEPAQKTANFLTKEYVVSKRGERPRSFAEAKQRYRNSVNLVIAMVAKGAKSTEDVIWKNTCEWLIACKVGLHVLSPRHDSNQVLEEAGTNPELVGAFFGNEWPVPLGSVASSAVDFDEYPANFSKVPWDFRGRELAEERKILIIDPIAHPEREVKKTIIHEVQHAVEHITPSSVQDRYRSEFNAKWISGIHSGESARKPADQPAILDDGKRVSGFNNARQLAIFSDLYEDYDLIAPAWNSLWSGKEFQKFVKDYKAPEGINLINSVRIDNLYLLLTSSRPKVEQLESAVAALTLEDQAAIRGPGSALAWLAIIDGATLSSTYRTRMLEKLELSAPPISSRR